MGRRHREGIECIVGTQQEQKQVEGKHKIDKDVSRVIDYLDMWNTLTG